MASCLLGIPSSLQRSRLANGGLSAPFPPIVSMSLARIAQMACAECRDANGHLLGVTNLAAGFRAAIGSLVGGTRIDPMQWKILPAMDAHANKNNADLALAVTNTVRSSLLRKLTPDESTGEGYTGFVGSYARHISSSSGISSAPERAIQAAIRSENAQFPRNGQ